MPLHFLLPAPGPPRGASPAALALPHLLPSFIYCPLPREPPLRTLLDTEPRVPRTHSLSDPRLLSHTLCRPPGGSLVCSVLLLEGAPYRAGISVSGRFPGIVPSLVGSPLRTLESEQVPGLLNRQPEPGPGVLCVPPRGDSVCTRGLRG